MFTRAGPALKTAAYGKFNKTLNFSNYYDCLTGRDLDTWTRYIQVYCEAPENKSRADVNTTIYIKGALQNRLVLG